MIGVLGLPDKHNPQNGLKLLVECLEKKYDVDHEITLIVDKIKTIPRALAAFPFYIIGLL